MTTNRFVHFAAFAIVYLIAAVPVVAIGAGTTPTPADEDETRLARETANSVDPVRHTISGDKSDTEVLVWLTKQLRIEVAYTTAKPGFFLLYRIEDPRNWKFMRHHSITREGTVAVVWNERRFKVRRLLLNEKIECGYFQHEWSSGNSTWNPFLRQWVRSRGQADRLLSGYMCKAPMVKLDDQEIRELFVSLNFDKFTQGNDNAGSVSDPQDTIPDR